MHTFPAVHPFRRPGLLAVVLALIGLALAPAPAHASGKIDWTSFDGLLPVDCDIIDATIEPNQHASTVIELVLAASPQTWWWKGVQIPDGFGNVHLLEVGNSIKQASRFMPTPFLQNGQSLHFMKAGFLGLHTGMYDLGDLGSIPGGARVTFRWVQDRCPDISGVLRADESFIPDWMMPGEQREVTVSVVNNGGSSWYADERFELLRVGKVDWGFPAMPFTTTLHPNPNPLVRSETAVFTFVITAPATAGYYSFNVGVQQRGGARVGVWGKTIAVQPIEPKPPATQPEPPPKEVVVPNVLRLSAAEAGTAIIDAGLRLSAPFDPSPGDPAKTVVFQSPLGGTRVVEDSTVVIGYVLDHTAPPGFAGIAFTNCRPGAVELYLLTYDGWQKRGTIASLRGDAGACPRPGTSPFIDRLVNGAANYYVVVDPAQCSDPTKPACRIYEWAAMGEAGGEVFYHAL